MKSCFAGLFMLILLAGCSAKAPSAPGPSPYTDPRSLTQISEAAKVKIGMHEREVVKILGPPENVEEGFYSGKRLWFRLYNPKYETIPTNFLVSIDRHGYVTFVSDAK